MAAYVTRRSNVSDYAMRDDGPSLDVDILVEHDPDDDLPYELKLDLGGNLFEGWVTDEQLNMLRNAINTARRERTRGVAQR